MNPSNKPEIRNLTPVSSGKVSANSQAVRDDAGLAEGIDSNRKSVQKPKRKKHRPKVIKEGKVAKTQKSTTTDPSMAKGNQTPVSQTEVTKIPTCHGDPQSLASPVEGSHIQVAQHWSSISSSISASVDPMPNVQDLWADSRRSRVTFDLNYSVMNHSPSKFSSLTDSSGQNVQFGSREQINQSLDFYDDTPDKSVSHLNSSVKQMQNYSNNFDHYLCASQSSTEQTFIPEQMLHGYRIPENAAVPAWHTERGWTTGNFNHEACTRVNPIPQGYRIPESPIIPPTCNERDAMNGNLKFATSPNDYLKFATNPNDQIEAAFGLHDSHVFLDVHAVGKKREHNVINGHQIPFDMNFEQSNSERQFYNDCLSTSSQSYLFPETCKRMRSENYSNLLNGIAGNFSSSSAYFSDNWDINQVPAIKPGGCTLADVQRLLTLEKSKPFQQIIGFTTAENNKVQQQNKPSLHNTSGNYFIASSDRQFTDFTTQHTALPDSSMNSLGEKFVHRNGDHQVESLEIRPTEHYTSDCFSLPNELSRYLTDGHTQLPCGMMNPTTKSYIQGSGIHQTQPLQNHMVNGQDLLEPHKTSTQDGTDGNSCINILAGQIRSTCAEVKGSFQPISQSARTDDCHPVASREITSANPIEKPKVRGRPKKEVELNGKPKVRGRPRKETEPNKMPKARGRPKKEVELNGKPKVRGRPRKEEEADGKPKVRARPRKEAEPNGKPEYRDAFCVSEASGICPRMTPVESERNGEIISSIVETYYHDKYSNLCSMQSHSRTISGAITPLLDSLDAIIEKLKLLNINKSDDTVSEVPKNALVPYEDKLGALVPFKGKVKKRHSRAKVNIDPITNLMWNLLMGPDMRDSAQGMDEDKEKFLEEERRVFRGRIDSFIARMHLVQGDRRFSPWKGSVVDSVVGVFLTQNVSDHLSSSAFMALAAKFPAKSEEPEKPAVEMSLTPEQKESCSGLFGESIKLQGNFFVEEIGDVRSLTTTEDNEGSNSNELIGSSSGDVINQAAGECPSSYRKSLTGSHENRPPGFIVPEIVTTGVVEVEDGSLEDVLSSQNSAISAQNSPDYLLNRTYTMGSSSLPNFTEQDMRNISNGAGISTVNSELSPIRDLQSIPNGKVGSSEYHEISIPSTSGLSKGVLLDLNRTYEPVHTSYMQNSLFDFTCASHGSYLDTSFSTGLDRVNISNDTQSELECSQLDNDIRVPAKTDGPKARKERGRPKSKTYDWDNLRKEVLHNSENRQRSHNARDTIDWEAVRQADVREISDAIRERGMNNMLAERIKEFLNRLVRDHGSIDLEWLRDVQPDKAKDYLLSIRGLGLKSVECVRLLTLHHMAFPVDTNVGRICVRLGWVPLQPLPESLQLHLLELYPMLEHIQKYLWPRLCKLDQLILYELHYQLITFGKVFCSKSRPNCNSCPMRAECKHFASAFASARLALPGPLEKSLVASEAPNAAQGCHKAYTDPWPFGQLGWNSNHPEHVVCGDQQPIIEEPSTPEPEPKIADTKEAEIEDFFGEDPDEIPTINLNIEEFTQNLKSYMQANNIEIEDADMSKALVAIAPEAASVPTSKLKNVNRLRTEHQVYDLVVDKINADIEKNKVPSMFSSSILLICLFHLFAAMNCQTHTLY
ncbi:hypothetical protein GUJ93_ZPchr0006g44608 [Zizania palustris]|uniref:HhH-GPD domain-containing protein n=1 Tax=Zizania palustris TaxID=103762 RepID=A0A8J5T6Y3_ZIZPA|nr:hypothetical protein GUJ93_ZPchr0006g44608 [Zizania palustris]